MNVSTVFTLLAVAIGVSLALVVGLLGRTISAIPIEDRAFKDPPPWGFRVLWWPIHWISHYLDGSLSKSWQHSLLTQLRKAGLDFQLTPAQFVASRLVSALVMAGVVGLGMSAFDPALNGLGKAFSSIAYFQVALIGAFMGYAYPGIWMKDRIAIRRSELLKTLPFYLDIITLCVEAGLNLQGAVSQAVAKGPQGVLRDEFQRALRDIRAGQSRASSLRAMAERVQVSGVNSFVSAVIQAETMGMNLGPVLRAQSEQRRSERFTRAEKLAMQAPVKMLFPLIAFIFPCTFIVLFFPIAMKLMHSGL